MNEYSLAKVQLNNRMILEKNGDVVWMLWVLNMALRINKPHLHTHIGTTKAHVSV